VGFTAPLPLNTWESTPGLSQERALRRSGYQPARHVPPSRSLSASMVYASPGSAGLLHPAVGCGIRLISTRSRPPAAQTRRSVQSG
jgi:hypothetical protein